MIQLLLDLDYSQCTIVTMPWPSNHFYDIAYVDPKYMPQHQEASKLVLSEEC
jgi:hypothetical protein